METNLLGRLKNLSLPRKSGLIPLFEAVINSIHAIEDRFKSPEEIAKNGYIVINIKREIQKPTLDLVPGRKPERSIVEFEVVDNGVGFTDANWQSFNRLDFTLKSEKGCRGVDRLTWLKAFDDVVVRSSYLENDVIKHRSFGFSRDKEVFDLGVGEKSILSKIETTVRLRRFRKDYSAAVEKTAEAIAHRLLEHALWYFVRKSGVPRITVYDDQCEAAVELNEFYVRHVYAESHHQEIEIKETVFDITHVKFRLKQERKHVLAYCAGQRLVLEEALDLPGLSSSVSDADGPYRYAGYVVSPYLDQKVRAERIGFDIEDEAEGLFSETEISRNDIRNAVRPLVEGFLGDSLQNNINAGKERVARFVNLTAPQYLPIVSYVREDELFVDPSISDAQLDRLLHTKKYQIEQALLEEGGRLLHPSLEDSVESYTKQVAAYLDKLQSVKQSDLAAYVAHRRVVLDLLRSALNVTPDGSYQKEAVIHNLIMPMGSTSKDIEYLRGNNLWLIDERLAFHQHYLGSDKTLASAPFTGAKGGKEPDIMGLNIYDNPHAFSDTKNATQATITIVEIKKPMRKNFDTGEDKDPIEQALGYLRRIRAGGVMSETGRPIPKAMEIPGYIYVLADLTESMRQRCEYASLNEAPDGLSYFGWNGNGKINAYIEVIDFGGVLDAATQRNAAFFEHLGLPTGRAV